METTVKEIINEPDNDKNTKIELRDENTKKTLWKGLLKDIPTFYHARVVSDSSYALGSKTYILYISEVWYEKKKI